MVCVDGWFPMVECRNNIKTRSLETKGQPARPAEEIHNAWLICHRAAYSVGGDLLTNDRGDTLGDNR